MQISGVLLNPKERVGMSQISCRKNVFISEERKWSFCIINRKNTQEKSWWFVCWKYSQYSSRKRTWWKKRFLRRVRSVFNPGTVCIFKSGPTNSTIFTPITFQSTIINCVRKRNFCTQTQEVWQKSLDTDKGCLRLLLLLL